MEAGVRQGCPLAPLLYLFVAQALLCWLRSQEVGIRLRPSDPDRTAACQFADDTEAVIDGEESVASFLGAMDTFGRASGQRLNLDKVELLRVGRIDPQHPQPPAEGPHPRATRQRRQQQPQQQPQQPQQQQQQQQQETISGLKVVATATALNLPVNNQLSAPQPDWPKLLEVAYKRMQRLSRFPLSAFGRATAASAYGLQTVTWHMEHGGPPPDATLEHVERLTARLVDRQQGPEDPGQRLTGVPNSLLAGHPSTGGFGLLPLRQHIRARHAIWAIRFIVGALAATTESGGEGRGA